MNVTREEVIQSATRLFKERGFLSTTIQDIAEDCGISKGSVYKFFPSKEDLFSEVFNQCHNHYFDQVDELTRLPGLSPEEQFVQQIVLRFRYFMEYKHILVEFTELPIQQDPKFQPLRHKVRGRLIRWHRECLLHVYGEEIQPYLWDLVAIYRAILKEYLFWIVYEERSLSLEETAKFILDKLHVLVKHMMTSEPKSMLNQTSFERYLNWGFEDRQGEKEQILSELFREMDTAMNTIPAGAAHRSEIRELSRFIQTEVSKEAANHPLIQASLSYLEREKELKSLIVQLRNVIFSGI
ncbi:TetR family transcriptional regulator [Paenibacillus timonensis]|uniref:TetR/AcrR family transcriptional regulator n=1 Tax=Paenibacillus sp. J53TS2 TaxID=2807197 RepID=UPI000FB06F2A|nr:MULTISPECIES: TetR/AcrR family transcriptional regulator [Paenibacillus]MUG84825.1 TetR family transcriptional regulator [Paenibacillus timonensis]GIP47922.1 putative HTH-type transcriptional regulator YerO [Paenibacillus sp. J53TS2]